MSQDTNETRQHFESRDIDRDMRKAHAETLRINPREHVRRLKAENLAILVALAAIAATGCYLLGVF